MVIVEKKILIENTSNQIMDNLMNRLEILNVVHNELYPVSLLY